MTATRIADPAGVLTQALPDASPDMMRHLFQTMIKCCCWPTPIRSSAAEHGRRDPDRLAHTPNSPSMNRPPPSADGS